MICSTLTNVSLAYNDRKQSKRLFFQIFVLKNKREMQLEREAAHRLNNNDGNLNNNSQAQSAPYVHPEKVIRKTKYSISKTTGKRVRRRKIKWRMHQNDDCDNMDSSLSMWKRRKFDDGASKTTASRTFNRDINAAINIRTLCKCVSSSVIIYRCYFTHYSLLQYPI